MSYLVRYRKAEDITGDYVSVALPGDATSVVLQHLFPLTAYEVNVFAQYDKGDSFPLSGEETTLEGIRRESSEREEILTEGFVVSQSKDRYETYRFQRRQQTVSECRG